MIWAVLILYALFSLFILLYSFVQLGLLISFLKSKKHNKNTAEIQDVPTVTIQLPIYNELYVVERLIDNICKIDYPKDKLEIQVLDDSTDETVNIANKKVDFWKNKGIDIQHIRREERTGYKAGALAYGTKICKGEFIAIFDADFLPKSDFLSRIVPYFENEKIGVVQARWTHLNKDFSLLTRLQAFGLDAHFDIEQTGRNTADHFINFNGTAGVWRKETILDAGGWQADTLTEDLDLSYRAQLKGWEFIYDGSIHCPSELPMHINALKSQQFRWTKGAAECTMKNLLKVIKHKNYKLSTKINAVFHLMNSFLFICIFNLAALSLPLFLIKVYFPEWEWYYDLVMVNFIAFGIVALMYYASFISHQKNKVTGTLYFLIYFPLFLIFSMGLSLHNTIAVFEGYIGKKSAFVRTPKFNVKAGNNWMQNKYLKSKNDYLYFIEFLLAIYFIVGICLSILWNDFSMLPFFVMLALGFGAIASYTFAHKVRKN